MAEVPFTQIPDAVIDATLVVAGPLVTGDSTSVFTNNQGDSDVSMHTYGTFGGSTVAILGSLDNVNFGKVDDTFGNEMSYTSPSGVKPVGPALQSIKGTVAGGAGVSVYIALYVVKKRG